MTERCRLFSTAVLLAAVLLNVPSIVAADKSSSWCLRTPGDYWPLRVQHSVNVTTVFNQDACGCGDVYDFVRGDLNVLEGDCNHDGVHGDCTPGNFTAALNAITPSSDVCIANNNSSGHVTDPRADPESGQGYFYLYRQVEGCGEDDSYHYGFPLRDRDFGINQAIGACPN
jgi:hypothetical protein